MLVSEALTLCDSLYSSITFIFPKLYFCNWENWECYYYDLYIYFTLKNDRIILYEYKNSTHHTCMHSYIHLSIHSFSQFISICAYSIFFIPKLYKKNYKCIHDHCSNYWIFNRVLCWIRNIVILQTCPT